MKKMTKRLEIISWCEEHNCPVVKVNWVCLNHLKELIKVHDKYHPTQIDVKEIPTIGPNAIIDDKP